LFVRPLEQGEMEFLAHLRKSRRQALRQRAQILMASMVYTPVYQIALICQTDEAHVRRVIHAFNDFGFESLNPKVGTGRPQIFEPAIRERIVAIALAPPTTLGEPLTIGRCDGSRVTWNVGEWCAALPSRHCAASCAKRTSLSNASALAATIALSPDLVEQKRCNVLPLSPPAW
jgi:hypothetical protein